MAARTTATPQGTGEGTPKIEKPMVARKPWTSGTTTIACNTPFTVLPRWSDLGFLHLGEGRDLAQLRPKAPTIAKQEEQHEEEEGQLEGGRGEAGDELLDEGARTARELGEAERDEGHERVRTALEPLPQGGDARGQRLSQDLFELLRRKMRGDPGEEGHGLGPKDEEGGQHGDEDRGRRDQHEDRSGEARPLAQPLAQAVLNRGEEEGDGGGDGKSQEKRAENPKRQDEDDDQRIQERSEHVPLAPLGHGRY